MTEDLVISKDKDASFKRACDACKLPYEIIGEGQDGDRYRVTFDKPSELFYLCNMMWVEMLCEKHYRILKPQKNFYKK